MSSIGNQDYTLNVATGKSDGDNDIKTLEGIVGNQNKDIVQVSYSQTEPTISQKVVTFQSTIDDIQELRLLNLIADEDISDELIKLIEKAEKETLKDKNKQTLKILNEFEAILNEENDDEENDLHQTAYEILIYDANYLKAHL